MKKSILASLLLTLSVAHAAPADLVGQWEINQRYCSDGLPANDAFTIGRDTMTLNMTKTEITTAVTYVDQGQSYNQNNFYTANDNYIYSNQTGKTQSAPYAITNKNELLLISAGFGKGGTCNEGQALIMKFIKK